MVIMMIDLKNKNILCNTKEELEAILKEAKNQKVTWCTGGTADVDDFDIVPVVLCFNNLITLSWNSPEDCDKEEYFITDLAKDLLNTDREMTAREFLNKFLDMAYDCYDCEKCKNIRFDGSDYKWCDSIHWSKDNIEQVYEIVKTGNKLKEIPEKVAINNISNYLDGKEQLNINALKLAIKVLEEKVKKENEK